MMRAVADFGNGQSHNRGQTANLPRLRPRRMPKRPGSNRERKLWENGYRLVAGVDEVGRGAWAGPLSVGVVVLSQPLGRQPRGLRDSKQIPEDDRELLFDKVASWCRAWAVGHAEPEECDRVGMTSALVLATCRAFSQLPEELLPEAVVLDGNFDFVSRAFETPSDTSVPHAFEPVAHTPVVHTVVKADATCVSVAAASVLAKVTRDRLMRECSGCYPPFDFERNKGYPSPSHQRALRGYGLSAIHRRSWVFVEKLPWADPYWSGRGAGPAPEATRALADDVAEELAEGFEVEMGGPRA
jgi:ribonuclease HII